MENNFYAATAIIETGHMANVNKEQGVMTTKEHTNIPVTTGENRELRVIITDRRSGCASMILL